MNWGNLATTAIITIVAIASYFWGYRDGVKFCARQMEPIARQAREIADALRDRKHE
jgi:hypothetical protein